jgi:hypothetical protein
MAIVAIERQRQLRAEVERSRRGRTGLPRASTSSTLKGRLLGLRLRSRPPRTPEPGVTGRRSAPQPEPR